MPEITIERSSDGSILIVAWHDIVTLWVKGPATMANQREMEQGTVAVANRWPRGIGILAVIDGSLPRPSPEIKREADAINARLATRMRAVSYVLPADGFHTMVARAVLATTKLVRRRTHPTGISTELRKGVIWLYQALGEDPERGTVDEFLAALEPAVRGEAAETLRTQKP